MEEYFSLLAPPLLTTTIVWQPTPVTLGLGSLEETRPGLVGEMTPAPVGRGVEVPQSAIVSWNHIFTSNVLSLCSFLISHHLHSPKLNQ